MKRSKQPPFLQAVHWCGKAIFNQKGYVWEVRRTGELKLGLWRKTWRKKSSQRRFPKRFVLIPGFGDTPLSWFLVLVYLEPFLKRKFDEIVIFDFPGFGGFLSAERAFPSMDLMMSTVTHTLDSLRPDTILGHSLGGWLTAHYASLCGSRVGSDPVPSDHLSYEGPNRVILANPSGIFGDEEVKQAWIDLFQSSMKQGFTVMRPHLFTKEPVWFRWVEPHFNSFYRREDILQFMNSFREDHAMHDAVKNIKAEVWLTWGENDTLIPASQSKAWLRYLKHELKEAGIARHHVVYLKNAGHSPHLERPAVTAALLSQILGEASAHRLEHRWAKRWWKLGEMARG